MNAPHWHLLLNHLPVVGFVLAIPLLLFSRWKKVSRGALLSAVLLLVLAGIGAYAGYLTGEAAEEYVVQIPEISSERVHAHHEDGELVKWAGLATAVLGVVLLVMGWRKRDGRPPVWLWALVLLATLGTVVLAGIAANSGGEIRHPEIREGYQPPSSALDAAKQESRELYEKAREILEDSSTTAKEKLEKLERALSDAGDPHGEGSFQQLFRDLGSRAEDSAEQIVDDLQHALDEAGDHASEGLQNLKRSLQTAVEDL